MSCMYHHRGYEHGGRGLGMILMGSLGLLLVATAVVLLILLLRRIGSRPLPGSAAPLPAAGELPPAPGGRSGPGPLEILDARLARGEIDVETYRAVRAELTGVIPPPQ